MYLVNLIIPTFIFNFFQLSLASKIMNERINIKSLKNIAVFIFLTIMVSLATFVFDNFFRSVINFLFLFAAYYIIFKRTTNKTFSVSFAVFSLFFISEIILSLLLALIFGKELVMSAIVKSVYLLSASNFMVGVIALSLYKIKSIKNLFSKIIKNYEKSKFTIIILIILFSLCVLANKNFLLIGFSLQYGLSILIVILFCLIIFLLLKEKNESITLSVKYDQLFHYLNDYEKELSKKSMSIHEFENQLIAIKGFNNGKNKQLSQYLETIICDIKTTETKFLKDMENVPNGGMKGLIYYKLNGLSEEGFLISTSISSNVKKNLFSKENLNTNNNIIKMIGILLDNAIESARESKEKQIFLEIYCERGIFFFVLSNTYYNIIDISKLDQIGYTTKGKGRGYGLSLARKIVNEHSFIHLDKQIINNLYVATLSVDTKNISNKR